MPPRKRQPEINPEDIDQTVVTIRMPKSLHKKLRSTAYRRETSMNLLCVQAIQELLNGVTRKEDAQTDSQPQTNDEAL